MLATDGMFRANGTFVSLPPVPEDLLSQGFRQAVLEFLVTERAIAEEPCTHILAWREEGRQGLVLAAGSPRTTGCAWGLTIGKVE